MTSQVRIYDIKAGKMDEWLAFFRGKVVPLHQKFGLPVRGAWVDSEHSQFVWVRDFAGTGSPEEQEQRYRDSEDRAREIGDTPKAFIEQMDVRLVHQAFPNE
jgi:hypothetical protein